MRLALEGWKLHVGMTVGVITLVAAAFGFGVTWNTWFSAISETPEILDEHRIETQQWIRVHERDHRNLSRQLDVITEVLYCTMQTGTPQEADRCLSDATRRNLNRLINGRRL